MNTKIKICGIKNVSDALYAEEEGADFIGLVFAKSKRQISLTEALEIKKVLTKAKLVAVFKDQHPFEVEMISDALLPYAAQVYDDLDYNLHESTIIIRSGTPNQIPLHPRTDMLLIDSPQPGSGLCFDWSVKINAALPTFLAGGLNIQNVATCIHTFKPFAVDVSSGVETNGEKDKQKIQAFIQAVKGANHVSI